jgi:hypothetical protein
VLVVSWIIVSESALDKVEEGSEDAVTMVATFCCRQSRLSQEQPPGPAAQLATSMRGGQWDSSVGRCQELRDDSVHAYTQWLSGHHFGEHTHSSQQHCTE